jgi:NADPH-dependent 2,4-dienoyl-CoA reductase/sulfur reductase-like enzyme
VQRVHASDGRAIECDLVVVGVGAIPHTELAAGAGIAVRNGIVTDEFLRTAVVGVFAAGDVANVRHPLCLHIFPGDDVGAHHKLRHLFGIDGPLSYEVVHQLVARWQPYAGVV